MTLFHGNKYIIVSIYYYINVFNMNKFTKTSLVVLLILLFISFGFNIWYVVKDKDVEIKEKTTIVNKTDTIRDTVLVVKNEKIIRVMRDTLTNIEFIRDSIDTTKVIANIPVTQKEYSDDSTYTAWVSGYKPNLDSINVYRKNVYINKETIIAKKDIKRLGIGPVVYGGFNMGTRQLDWGVGIGITYHILEW